MKTAREHAHAALAHGLAALDERNQTLCGIRIRMRQQHYTASLALEAAGDHLIRMGVTYLHPRYREFVRRLAPVLLDIAYDARGER